MEVRENLWMQRRPKHAYGQGKSRARCFVSVRNGEFVGTRQPGIRISLDDLEDAFVSGLGDGPVRVTPEGAALLVRLYEDRAFELKRKSDRIEDASALKELAASREALEARTEQRRAERQAAHTARQAVVSDPVQLGEDQFTWNLLNSIFAHHLGYGGGHSEIEIGGVRVTKTLAPYASNSRKNLDFEVEFSWTGADGNLHRLTRESRYGGNRRNDPGRNWGLGPE
jgi:hypothetical protein